MFGILNAIFSAGVILNDHIEKSYSSARAQSQAQRNGENIYFDANGIKRYASTGSKVGIITPGQTILDDYDNCSCETYITNGVRYTKKTIKGIINKNYMVLRDMETGDLKWDIDYENYSCFSYPKISMSRDLRYFEAFFDNSDDAINYCREKYGDNFFSYVNIETIRIPDNEEGEKAFEYYCNLEKEPKVLNAIQLIDWNGKKWIKGALAYSFVCKKAKVRFWKKGLPDERLCPNAPDKKINEYLDWGDWI